MPRLIVETRPEPLPLAFAGDSSDLVWFLSFAAVEQFGSQHELSQAAMLLRHKHKLRLAPLLRFAAAGDDDAEELERVWQAAGPLAEVAAAVAGTLTASPADAQLAACTEGFPQIAARLAELAALAGWAAEHGCEVRLTYEL